MPELHEVYRSIALGFPESRFQACQKNRVPGPWLRYAYGVGSLEVHFVVCVSRDEVLKKSQGPVPWSRTGASERSLRLLVLCVGLALQHHVPVPTAQEFFAEATAKLKLQLHPSDRGLTTPCPIHREEAQPPSHRSIRQTQHTQSIRVPTPTN